MDKLLITGASGLLGSNLVFAATDYYAVTAITNQHHLRHQGVEVFATDLTKTGVAFEIMRAVQPDVVVHAAAEANVDRCEQDEQWAYLHNRDMAHEVAAAARSTGAYLIHISTDAVFDDRRDHHVESDSLMPINVYSRSKVAGETVVQEAHPEAAIIRTNFYGWNMLDKYSLAEWFLDHLEQGQACCGFDDVWITPLLVNDLVSFLMRMMEMKHSGPYHLGGADCVSKYQFGRLLASVAGFDPGLIRPGSVKEAGLKAPRPLKLCLDSSKICRALDIETPSFIEGIKRFVALRAEGYVESLKAMNK